MRDLDDVVLLARAWLDAGNGIAPAWSAPAHSKQRYAPQLAEALRNGPLDDDALDEAEAEARDTGDDSANTLIDALRALEPDDRDLVLQHLAEGWRS